MVYSHTRIVTMQVGSTSVSHLLYLPYCRTSEMNQADWAYILTLTLALALTLTLTLALTLTLTLIRRTGPTSSP